MKNSTKPLPLHQKTNSVSWFTVLKHSCQSALRIDRSQITAVQAVRGTIGFVLPLAIGVATGHVVEGVSLAGGAATLGAVGLTYTYRARIRTLLLACLAIACSAFVGSLVGRIDWLAILVLGLWGFGAGLLASISQVALVIGIQAVVALIILSHFALSPLQALLQALLLLAGALFQTLLASIPFPHQRAAPERVALASVYQKLATYVADTTNEQHRQSVRDALLKAYTTVQDTNMRSPQGKIFVALFEEAERMRLVVIALTRLLREVQKDTTIKQEYATYAKQILQASAGILRQVANEVTLTRKTINVTELFQQLEQVLATLHRQDALRTNDGITQQIGIYCNLLHEQLYTAQQLAEARRNDQNTLLQDLNLPQQARFRFRDALMTLQANLTPRSVFFRHAVRQGVTLALATALYRITPLPIERGYWIALTALLVLRPDFSTTFTRGIARLLGTLLGAVLTTVLVATIAPAKEILVLLDALAAYLAFSFLLANYALFSAFITVEVVFLLTFVEPQPLVTAAYRATDTIIGGVLALGLYLVWPTWEHPHVLDNITHRLETLRHYFVAVMQAYAHPETYTTREIEALRINSRLARSNASASVQRSQQEPETSRVRRVDHELADGILTAADLIAQNVIVLEAFLLENPAHYRLSETLPFTHAVDEAFHVLITSIQEEQPITTFPDVQATLTPIEHAVTSASNTHTDLHFVCVEAKSIAHSVNTMKQLLATHLEDTMRIEK